MYFEKKNRTHLSSQHSSYPYGRRVKKRRTGTVLLMTITEL